MRVLAAFLISFSAALLFFTLGEALDSHVLVIIGLVTFGAVAAALMLRGTSNAIDSGTIFITGPRAKDE